MIDITEQKEKCFALKGGKAGHINCQCDLLIACMCKDCKFYKPEDCTDWIRIDEGDKVYIMDPDEYDETRRG